MRAVTSGTMRNSRVPAAQQSLFLELPAQPSATPSGESRELAQPVVGRPQRRHLWLCIYLPGLPLEALDDDGAPLARAVFDDNQGMRKVLLANAQARAAGIGPGLSANAAMALVPDLQLEQRDPAKEQRVLRKLAGWSEKFTSFVSIEAPAMLLLEIAGSLRLFGGLRDLRQRIVRGFSQQGFRRACRLRRHHWRQPGWHVPGGVYAFVMNVNWSEA